MGRCHITKLSTKGRRCSLAVVRVSRRIPFALNTHHKHSFEEHDNEHGRLSLSMAELHKPIVGGHRGSNTQSKLPGHSSPAECILCPEICLISIDYSNQKWYPSIVWSYSLAFPSLGWWAQARMLTFSLCSSQSLSLEQADKHPGFPLKSTKEH